MDFGSACSLPSTDSTSTLTIPANYYSSTESMIVKIKLKVSNSLGITDTAFEELEYLPEPLPIIAIQSVPKKFNSNDRVMIDTDITCESSCKVYWESLDMSAANFQIYVQNENWKALRTNMT